MTEEKRERKKDRKAARWVSFFPGWCKQCRNCVEFCPTHALETDEWGYPYMARAEDCTGCHLCEKLCPDLAVVVGEESSPPAERPAAPASSRRRAVPGSGHSPEKLAPKPNSEEETADAKEPSSSDPGK